jgi:hypothetical protein
MKMERWERKGNYWYHRLTSPTTVGTDNERPASRAKTEPSFFFSVAGCFDVDETQILCMDSQYKHTHNPHRSNVTKWAKGTRCKTGGRTEQQPSDQSKVDIFVTTKVRFFLKET